MIICTSISPKHINADIQQQAVDSWNALGLKVFSFNHPSEKEYLSHYKNVTFVETNKTMKHIFGKHYVGISEMIDWCKGQDDEHFCFINSDIELVGDSELLEKLTNRLTDSMVVAHRNDYERTKEETNTYTLGIDVFFMNKKHLEIFPPSLFCMGQCFWDYNIPFTAIKNNIPVINMQNKFAFHKKHNVQYSPKNWEITGKFFLLEHNLHQFSEAEIGRLNQVVDNFLKLNMKYEEL